MEAKIKEPSGGPFNLIVVGGGAAGFFCALSAAEVNSNLRILVLDGGKKVLRKVRISGGGRCNLTHHCFDPKALSEGYPRGGRQLRGAFHHWQPKDTIEWFSQRGVPTKTEADGRMFPVSDRSQSVIDCLEKALEKPGSKSVRKARSPRLIHRQPAIPGSSNSETDAWKRAKNSVWRWDPWLIPVWFESSKASIIKWFLWFPRCSPLI